MHATPLRMMFTYERNKVRALAVEKAFQLAAFFDGFPAHEYCIVTHHKMSIVMVSPFKMRS